MVTRKNWEEFRSTGLVLFVNQILHVFGWALVFDYSDYDTKTGTGTIKGVYPARVKFRGFDPASVGMSYRKISEYMVETGAELLEEAANE